MEEESPFGLDELFFSRTDPGGVIRAGNPVFQRVSGYDWDALVGRPHKIIRHPDTPRAVFWLLWERLKRGAPIAAYVKNRARDGRIYWVFALATPIDDGYLSVRFKPTSPLFDVIRDLYPRYAEAERADKARPEASAGTLCAHLRELGFRSYEAFMTRAICEEARARRTGLGEPADGLLDLYDGLMGASHGLLHQAETIVAACADNELMPLNLQIQSGQLGQDGVAIAAIARNYGGISQSLIENVNRFHEAASAVEEAIETGLFLYCAARLQQEMAAYFDAEQAGGDPSASEEARRLRAQEAAYREQAMQAPVRIASQSRTFEEACIEMARLAAGLEVTRVMGKVECARLETPDGLPMLLGELGELQKAISTGLRELSRQNGAILQDADRIVTRVTV